MNDNNKDEKTWNEYREFVLKELDRVGKCTDDNTKAIFTLDTRLAVLCIKVTLMGGGGGMAVLLFKLIFDSLKK